MKSQRSPEGKGPAMTPPVPSIGAAAVSGAIRRAAERTGVGFDYLYRVAVRESALNPEAKAKTSSATGLFQFIDQTWLGAVKKYGAAHGLSAYAADIVRGPNGRFAVADPARRQEILDLRLNPDKAAALAGELARDNKASLEKSLGRAVDAAELYAAHFLGPKGAATLLGAKPDAEAAALLPAAAAANRPVFYDGARARSVDEIVASFRKTIGGAREAVAAAASDIERKFAGPIADGAGDFVRASFAGAREQAARLSTDAFGALADGAALRSLSPLAIVLLQAIDLDGRRDDAARR